MPNLGGAGCLVQVAEPEEETVAEKARKAALAVAEREGVPYRHCKLGVLGESAVGKTSLINSLTGKPFQAYLESTVGASSQMCELGTQQVGSHSPILRSVPHECLIHECLRCVSVVPHVLSHQCLISVP